jgi:hypothetical protein
VLWTSVAVGALRGYGNNATTAARWNPAYRATFAGGTEVGDNHPGVPHPTHPLAHVFDASPYCNTGLDGLPGSAWCATQALRRAVACVCVCVCVWRAAVWRVVVGAVPWRVCVLRGGGGVCRAAALQGGA